MTKFKSQALHIIKIKSCNAGGSGNPPSLIPALWNIGILLHKQTTHTKHSWGECTYLLSEQPGENNCWIMTSITCHQIFKSKQQRLFKFKIAPFQSLGIIQIDEQIKSVHSLQQ